MPQIVYILFGAAFTVATMTAAGHLMLRSLGVKLDRAEYWLLSFVCGAPLLSTVVFLLCSVNLARKGVFLIVGAGILACCVRRRAGTGGSGWMAVPAWFVLIFAAYALLYLLNAAAPEISPDGSTYHLGLVARYYRERGFHRITNNMYASLAQGIEMLFLFAFAFGRHSAAALVHCAFLLALPLLMLAWARRAGFAVAGACAAIFVFVSPMAGIDGTSAYIDMAVACSAFAVFYLLQIWDTSRNPKLAVPIGLLAGFCYASKYTAALAIPYAIGFVLWKGRRLRPALAITASALVVMLPWIIKNIWWVENPVAPFLNALFPNPYIQLGFEKEYSWYMRHYDTIRSNSELPWAVTVDGRLSGFLGPLYLLSPIALFALRRREGRQLLLAAAVFGVTYYFNVGARFLIPAMPFIALAMAIVLSAWKPLAIGMTLIHAVISWPAVTSLYCNGTAWRLHEFPWRAALRIEPEDTYLGRKLANYHMTRLIERTVPRNAKVLGFSGVADAYTTRDILVAYESAANKVLGDISWTPLVATYTPNWLHEFRFPAEPLRRIRVVQTAVSATDQWNISELRVYAEGRELPRAPDWRIHAEPNPWEIQLAFDNTPVTRWRTWLPLSGGEFVEVDLGTPQRIDAVRLECARDQLKVKMKLEGQDASGRWKTLAEAPEISDGPPIPGLRRMATQELKLRGITHLLVYNYDFGRDDYMSHPDQWGISVVGLLGGDRLYRID
jgi:hypothetical protein